MIASQIAYATEDTVAKGIWALVAVSLDNMLSSDSVEARTRVFFVIYYVV